MILVYDIEIEKAIQGRGEKRFPDIEYCQGFQDHANMGVSCIGAISLPTWQPYLFFKDNFQGFFELADTSALLVGFNNIRFDNPVIAASTETEIPQGDCFDILEWMWVYDGLDPDHFSPRSHGGYSLDVTSKANGLGGKTGNGALSPMDFQRGQYGRLGCYCLRDVWLTATLFEKALEDEFLHPKTGETIMLPRLIKQGSLAGLKN